MNFARVESVARKVIVAVCFEWINKFINTSMRNGTRQMIRFPALLDPTTQVCATSFAVNTCLYIKDRDK